jgi:branched-chain amino acid transport system substrate-binding protein
VAPLALALALALAASACSGGGSRNGAGPPVRVGLMYPMSGSQGPGGLEEERGAALAATLVNHRGGIAGRPIELVPLDVPEADAVPAAIQTFASKGVRLVVGSYGSTISAPAAAQASARGMLFWETGAVGELFLPTDQQGDLVFQVAPSGAVLGRSAIQFVADHIAPSLHRDPAKLRYTVVAVDDAFGDAVSRGAADELRERGYTQAGAIRYDPRRYNPTQVVRQIAATRPDVLFAVAYIGDGVALRRETVRQHLHLVANIGTSSSYCMPAFGAALGRDAVGLFASDKPDADSLNQQALNPQARELLATAQQAYRAAYHQEMSAAALAGFAGGWALFHWVLPSAGSDSPVEVARAARALRLPAGTLPNGSGLKFGQAGTPDATVNLRATSVIWEWTAVNRRQVVWPPQFATGRFRPLPMTA